MGCHGWAAFVFRFLACIPSPVLWENGSGRAMLKSAGRRRLLQFLAKGKEDWFWKGQNEWVLMVQEAFPSCLGLEECWF